MLSTGCIRRSLTVRSDPPGAELIINDKPLGATPYTYDFVWYGWHRVTLTKPGYERYDDVVLIKCPFYLWVPFDLVMEMLPFRIRDNKVLSYTLIPMKPLSEPRPPVVESTPAPPTTKKKEGP